jgi:hypothetical protein
MYIKGVTDVFVDGKYITNYGNPLCHYMYGFREAMKMFDTNYYNW